MYRSGHGWRHNVAQGAKVSRCVLTAEIARLASGAAQTVGAEIAGVDLIEDADGRVYVLEVNHGVEFVGFQQALGDRVSVAARVVDHLLNRSRQCRG